LRGKVGKAPCPICRHNNQYFNGALAWFPIEKVVRAIGRDCGKSHFGSLLMNQALAAGRRIQAIESAQNFLMDNLPNVASVRCEAIALAQVAMDSERLQITIQQRSSKKACRDTAKLIAQGPLKVRETTEISFQDVHGKSGTKTDERVVARYAIMGGEFLAPRNSIKAQADNLLAAIDRLPTFDNEEQVISFVADDLAIDDSLFEVENRLRQIRDDLISLRKKLAQAQQFLAPSNLRKFADWSGDRRANAAFVLGFDSDFSDKITVRIAGNLKRAVLLPIPQSLRTPLPAPSGLSALR
jgi:hypothetical protein